MKDKSIKLHNVNPDCVKFMYYFQLGVLKKKTKQTKWENMLVPISIILKKRLNDRKRNDCDKSYM